MSITQDLIKELFEYKDGQLYWKNPTSSRCKSGQVAGAIGKRGYWRVGVNYKHYTTHRIVFLLFHGYLPKLIDHIDGNCLNNKIENLREATTSENLRNSKLSAKNTSGTKGVTWDKQTKSWSVGIMVNYKQIRIGRFKDLELAQLVAQEARNKYHKEFANYG
jgi:hypothetical protein